MQHKNHFYLIVMVGVLLVITASFWLGSAPPANAQCGSQASSCKNCHEVQGELPVNADGTAWHQSHAFGDFCYLCHAGNNQAQEQTAAHEGMVPPLSDVKAACQQCHYADLEARADIYATALGVEVGIGSAAPTTGSSEAAPVSAESAASATSSQSCNDVVVDDPNLINYTQSYDEIVLGKTSVNWGNTLLIGMIGLIAVGGGGFVVTREKLVSIQFGDTRAVDNEYPAEVVEMLPQIANLKTKTRKSLKNILNNPKKADTVLDLMDAVVSEETDKE